MNASFLRAVILATGFKPDEMERAQAALLLIGLHCGEFTAGHLPKDVCGESKSLAGCATGSLISQGLICVVGRVKSPNPEANGRKCNLLRITPGKEVTARTWLLRHGIDAVETDQLSLAI